MLDTLWDFFKNNREALSALGAGFVVIVGGGWALFKHFAAKDEKSTQRTVSADHGGVAIGGDARKSPITTGTPAPPKR